ncbi:MAG: ABC transporter permease, partial [Deltaproteobacteria bacterium]|nr:ABC transporter permease [Deltaproteobacteria bacterium]
DAVNSLQSLLLQRLDPADFGLSFQPVREQALKAVNESLDFGQLFLGMSFFLIASAVLLTVLLFAFGVEQRMQDAGILRAIGCRTGQVKKLFLLEGLLVAALAAVPGALLGIGYARGLVWMLGRYWQDALANAAILFHADPGHVATGAVIGFTCSAVAIAWMGRQVGQRSIRLLLTGEEPASFIAGKRPGRRNRLLRLSGIGTAAAILLAALAGSGSGRNLLPAFFGAGTLLLLAGLGFAAYVLSLPESSTLRNPTFYGLAFRNAARRSGRSLAAVSLLACGTFMLVAVSCMRENLSKHADEPESGTGGFALYAETTLPLPDPLNAPKTRKAFRMDSDKDLNGIQVVSMKLRAGDDASCFNLNRARTPPLVGVVPEEMIRFGAFASPHSVTALWQRLEMDLPDGEIPALVGDTDTAQWGLEKQTGLKNGDTLEYRDETGRIFHIRLVGSLPMRLSVFQGRLLISMKHFVSRYPSEEGYRVFLLKTPPGTPQKTVRNALNRRFARIGMDAETTLSRIENFYSVESTYLRIFLALGGLGLLLGSIGMGLVVLRNVLERRSELALLVCTGFTRSRVVRMVIAEHAGLLAAGLLIGVAAGALGVWPSLRDPTRDIPFGHIAGLLALLLLLGLSWITLAAKSAVKGSLISALRNE